MEQSARADAAAMSTRTAPVREQLGDLRERTHRLREELPKKREHLDTLRQIAESREGYHLKTAGVLLIFVGQVHHLVFFLLSSLDAISLALMDIYAILVAAHEERATLVASAGATQLGLEAQRGTAVKELDHQALMDRVRILEFRLQCMQEERVHRDQAARLVARGLNAPGSVATATLQPAAAPYSTSPQHRRVKALRPALYASTPAPRATGPLERKTTTTVAQQSPTDSRAPAPSEKLTKPSLGDLHLPLTRRWSGD